MATSFAFPKTQRFACKDCPARCCKLPAAIQLTADEQGRLLADPWAANRLGKEGAKWVARGILPMRERSRTLACVFLDDDDLCALQKEHGHEYLPSPCQAFPFGFIEDEAKRTVALMSRLCPSIRDNTGELVDERRLQRKLLERGEPERLSTALSTVDRRLLSRSQYLDLVALWSAQLAREDSPANVLAHLYDMTCAFELRLSTEAEKPSDMAVQAALAAATSSSQEQLQPTLGTPFHVRSLHAYLLGNLCYPSRILLPQRVDRPSPWHLMMLRSLHSKLKWLTMLGRVDLLYVAKPVPLRRVANVSRFLGNREGQAVRRFLVEILERRHTLSHPRYLRDILVDLGLITAVVSRYARCRAASEARADVNLDDVAEGTSVAELVLASHASFREQSRTMLELRRTMMASREHFRSLLGSEA